MCHAGIAVYGSVWVDLYAPKESATSWLGAMQASATHFLAPPFSWGLKRESRRKTSTKVGHLLFWVDKPDGISKVFPP